MVLSMLTAPTLACGASIGDLAVARNQRAASLADGSSDSSKKPFLLAPTNLGMRCVC